MDTKLNNTTVRRPILRYHGGKWILAPWIISQFPKHRVYVEPFGGAGSVLLRKPRCYAEVYNDRDGEIVNLFQVARDHSDELIRMVELTPFSRMEFDRSYSYATTDEIEQARRTLVRCGMGFGSTAMNTNHKTGFRGSATRSGTHPGIDWGNQAENLKSVVERMRGVIIENRPAIDVMNYHDGKDTLCYIDPPYPHETRKWLKSKDCYVYEMTDDDHRELADAIHNLKGKVVISGYPCALYDRELYPNFRRIERQAFADGAKKRTEVLWMNFEPDQPGLFNP